jgi:hypothetical protein
MDPICLLDEQEAAALKVQRPISNLNDYNTGKWPWKPHVALQGLSQCCGSGSESFYHQAKIVRKTVILTVW